MSYTEVIEERGNFRVSLVADEDPLAPEFYAGDPIIDIEIGTLVYGGMEEKRDREGKYAGCGAHALVERVLDVFNEKVRYNRRDYWRGEWFGEWDVETFERYVRIFHDGSIATISGGYREGTRYLALGLPEYRRAHGCDESLVHDAPEVAEWTAYVEGDVYGVVVEQRSTEETTIRDWCGNVISHEVFETWDEVDSCWGYYGYEYAQEAAVETLDSYATTIERSAS